MAVDGPDDNKIGADLIRKIERLTEPRSPADLLQDATGLFLPGFLALPSVSIVEAKPPRGSRGREELATGDLLSFEADGDTDTSDSDKRFRGFFTPIENMVIPLVSVSDPSVKTRGLVEIQLESEVGWSNINLHFAWLPWDRAGQLDSGKIECLIRAVDARRILPGRLRVSLVTGGGEEELPPKWGLGSWVPAPHVESIVFPMNYARRLVEPFMFRLEMPGDSSLPNVITLRFKFPESELVSIYRMAGLSGSLATGFSIVGNAVPVANVDLKAWEPDLTFGDFTKTSNMKPLGLAGVAPFKRRSDSQAQKGDLNTREGPSLLSSAHFSVGFDMNGSIVSRYLLADLAGDIKDHQLLFWMTRGERMNGMSFRYVETDEIQPMHKTSTSLNHATTLVPCFGGADCSRLAEGDLYKSLMLDYNSQSHLLLHRDSLVFAVRDLLARMGYGDRAVKGPVVELRVTAAGRERVTVVYVKDNISNPVRPHHMNAIQDYLDQRMPIGSRVVVEVQRG